MQLSELELEVTRIVSGYSEAETLASPKFFGNHKHDDVVAAAGGPGVAAVAAGPGQAAQVAGEAVGAIATAQGNVQFYTENSIEVAILNLELSVSELIDARNQALKNYANRT